MHNNNEINSNRCAESPDLLDEVTTRRGISVALAKGSPRSDLLNID